MSIRTGSQKYRQTLISCTPKHRSNSHASRAYDAQTVEETTTHNTYMVYQN